LVPFLRLNTISPYLASIIVTVSFACTDTVIGPTPEDKPENHSGLTGMSSDVAVLEISSPNFQEKTRPRKRILKENTCYGKDISPPLNWTGVPSNAKSLALIVEEPEDRLSNSLPFYTVPASGAKVHWVLYNIPPIATGITEAISTSTKILPDGTVQGRNGFEQLGYTGPCPPPSVVAYHPTHSITRTSDIPHEFYFRLYALDDQLDLLPGSTAKELISAMDGHVLGYGETMGKSQGPRQQGWYSDSKGTPLANTPTPGTS